MCQVMSLALGYSSVDPHRGISVFSGLYRGPLRDCPVPFLLQALTTQLLWLLNADSLLTSHACGPPPSPPSLAHAQTPPHSPTKPGVQRLMKTDTCEASDCVPRTRQSQSRGLLGSRSTGCVMRLWIVSLPVCPQFSKHTRL